MPHIEQLAPHVADLIAAGEVVERPASVVKELVENAIDAGATALVVEIRGGGMGMIRVTDNGCGIDGEELPAAFLRHATSKLRTAGDLAAIGTLGFRGEALAAISAVSRVEIQSRRKGADVGASLFLEAGKAGKVSPAGCPEGTTITVSELFYNTPARLKFMKSDTAESSAVNTVMQQIALSRPDVSIRYIRDGKEELHTPGDGKLLSAIYAARGREFALSLVNVEGSGEGISVTGFVTDPMHSRGSRSMQTFFCCGRMIKSSLLTAALEEAYANRQMKGKFPGCVLHIDLPLDQVDVNVHPAKTVVKFARERAVFSAVHHVVKDALDGKSGSMISSGEKSAPAAAKPAAHVVNPRGDFYHTMDAKTYRESVTTDKKGNLTFAKPAPRPAAPMPRSTSELGGRVTMRDSAASLFPPVKKAEPISPLEKLFAQPVEEKKAPVEVSSAPPVVKEEEAVQEAMELPEQTSFIPEAPTPWRYAGEVLNTYIIAEDGDDVYLIDKHAAHERVNFDRLKAGAEPIMSQELLSGVAVDLSGEQYAAVLENLPLLEEFGFRAEDFGTGCIMVRAIPAEIDTGLARETLEMLSDKLLICGTADPAAARDAMLHTVACKASIKGGWKSDERELKALIEKVQSGEVQFCPHGRPVKVKLSKYEIEKMFKRA